MSKYLLDGHSSKIEIKSGSTYAVLGGEQSNELSLSKGSDNHMSEVTGSWEINTERQKNWSLNCKGMLSIETLKKLLTWIISKTKLDIRVKSGTYIHTGSAYIKSLDFSANKKGSVEYSIKLQGTGKLEATKDTTAFTGKAYGALQLATTYAYNSDVPAGGGNVQGAWQNSAGTALATQSWTRYEYGAIVETGTDTLTALDETVTATYTLSNAASGVAISKSGSVSAPGLGKTAKSRTALGTVTYTLTRNGKSTTAHSTTVYQQANTYTTKYTGLTMQVHVKDGAVAASGGNYTVALATPSDGVYAKQPYITTYTSGAISEGVNNITNKSALAATYTLMSKDEGVSISNGVVSVPTLGVKNYPNDHLCARYQVVYSLNGKTSDMQSFCVWQGKNVVVSHQYAKPTLAQIKNASVPATGGTYYRRTDAQYTATQTYNAVYSSGASVTGTTWNLTGYDIASEGEDYAFHYSLQSGDKGVIVTETTGVVGVPSQGSTQAAEHVAATVEYYIVMNGVASDKKTFTVTQLANDATMVYTDPTVSQKHFTIGTTAGSVQFTINEAYTTYTYSTGQTAVEYDRWSYRNSERVSVSVVSSTESSRTIRIDYPAPTQSKRGDYEAFWLTFDCPIYGHDDRNITIALEVG